mmetsp:Transcript_12480/g.39046  ORF Transcript_12480/g.39046 Transcript_12480/m.39046 type:complete len:468 (+) Transcript_12480:2529-3932(+)
MQRADAGERAAGPHGGQGAHGGGALQADRRGEGHAGGLHRVPRVAAGDDQARGGHLHGAAAPGPLQAHGHRQGRPHQPGGLQGRLQEAVRLQARHHAHRRLRDREEQDERQGGDRHHSGGPRQPAEGRDDGHDAPGVPHRLQQPDGLRDHARQRGHRVPRGHHALHDLRRGHGQGHRRGHEERHPGLQLAEAQDPGADEGRQQGPAGRGQGRARKAPAESDCGTGEPRTAQEEGPGSEEGLREARGGRAQRAHRGQGEEGGGRHHRRGQRQGGGHGRLPEGARGDHAAHDLAAGRRARRLRHAGLRAGGGREAAGLARDERDGGQGQHQGAAGQARQGGGQRPHAGGKAGADKDGGQGSGCGEEEQDHHGGCAQQLPVPRGREVRGGLGCAPRGCPEEGREPRGALRGAPACWRGAHPRGHPLQAPGHPGRHLLQRGARQAPVPAHRGGRHRQAAVPLAAAAVLRRR